VRNTALSLTGISSPLSDNKFNELTYEELCNFHLFKFNEFEGHEESERV
jgi:hypothetical protein